MRRPRARGQGYPGDMRVARRLRLLACALVAVAVPAPAAVAADTVPAFGAGALKSEWLAGSDASSGLDGNGVADLDRMAADGMGLYRSRFRQDAVVVDGVASRWTQLDNLVRQAAVRGVTVLPVLINMPGEVYTPPKTSAARAAFGEFAAAAARRYGPAGSFWSTCVCPKRPIRAWEVWNEPNIVPFWDVPSATEYAALLKTTRRRLREADPAARIVFGGLAYPATTSALKREPNAFLEATVAAAGATSFDALSLHSYYRQAHATDAGVDSLLAATVETLRRVGGVQASGAPVQQVWLTEFGRYTYRDDPATADDEAATSEANQAVYYDRFLTRLLAHRVDWNLGPVLPYALRDAAQPTANWHRYGLRLTDSDDTDLRAKTAWETFAARSRGAAELPLPAPRPDPELAVEGLGAAIRSTTPSVEGAAGVQADDPTVRVRILEGGTERDAFEVIPDGVTGRYSGKGTKELAEGTYTAEASQADGAGTLRTVATQPFEVDVTKPVVSVTDPASATTQADVELAGTAGDAGSATDASADDASVAVRLFRRTSTNERVQVGDALGAKRTGISWSVPVTGLVGGTYEVEAVQADAAGNVSATAIRTFTVDRSAPTVSVEQPPTPTNDRLPAFSGAAGTLASADDNTPDAGSVTVIVRRGSTEVERFSADVGAEGAWSGRMTTSLTEDGSYTVTVEQRDGAGNTGAASRSFAYDGAKPAVRIDEPAAATNDSTPDVEGMAGLAVGDESTVWIAIVGGPTTVERFTAGRDAATGAFAQTVPVALADGAYTAEVVQRDAAGNATAATRSFRVDSEAPAVELSGPAGPTNDPRPALSGRAGTAAGDLDTIRIEVHEGDTATGPVADRFDIRAAADGTVSGRPSRDLPDGTYTAVATQRDEARNEGVSRAVTFRVDTAAPRPSLTKPAIASETDDPTPALEGRAGTAPGDGSNLRVRVYAGSEPAGTPVRDLSASASHGAWSLEIAPALAAGRYTVEVAQDDAAGNTGASAAVTLVVKAASQVAQPPVERPLVEPGAVRQEPANQPPPERHRPADTRAPAFALTIGKPATTLASLLRAGGLNLRLDIDEAATAHGELRLPAAVAKKLGLLSKADRRKKTRFIRLDVAFAASGAPGELELVFKLSRRVRRKLADAARVKVSVIITVIDEAGNEQKLVKRLTLEPANAKAKRSTALPPVAAPLD